MSGSLQDCFSLHVSCYISRSTLLHYLVVCVLQDRLLASNWLGWGQMAQWRLHWCCNESWTGRPIRRQELRSQAADWLALYHGGLQVASECGRVCGCLWRVESEREKDGELIQQSSLRLWQWVWTKQTKTLCWEFLRAHSNRSGLPSSLLANFRVDFKELWIWFTQNITKVSLYWRGPKRWIWDTVLESRENVL